MNEPKLRFKADDGSQFPEWEEHKIKEFVTESNILGHTGKEAKKLTVKLWAKGVVPKENVFSGSENTQYYIRHSGQLMYGKLDFLNCAFGIVPPELDGYESTLDAPAFDIHDISDKFLLSYVTRKIFYKKNGDIANGSRKAKRIHPDVFGEMSIMAPSLPEQQKIAEFLSTIDTVIEKQKKTVSAWEERKKGVMQKLFSQEVRFKADDGSGFPEWEEKKLGDVADVKVGEKPTLVSDNAAYEYVNAGTTNSGYVDSYNCDGDTVTTPSRGQGGIGYVGYQKHEFWLGPLCYKIKSNKDDILTKFMYYALSFDSKKIVDLKKVGTIPAINRADLIKLYMNFPCLAEQQKIADCLSSLDEVIEKQKATLAAWEELKKGLLQQMFA